MRNRPLTLLPFALALSLVACSQGSPSGPTLSDGGGVGVGDAATSGDTGVGDGGGGNGGAGTDASAASVPCNALTPAPSFLYVLFDESSGMRDFVGPAGVGASLGDSLRSPLLAQAREGLMSTPAAQADCSSASNEYASLSPGGVPFEAASQGASDIASSLQAASGASLSSGSSPWYLEAALAGAYSALESATAATPVNHRALLLFLDRDFNVATPDCAPPHADAPTESASAASAGVETYVVYLANADYADGGVPGTPVAHAQSLAHTLDGGGAAFFNASSQVTGAAATDVSLAFATVAAELGACLYETPAGFAAGTSVAFQDYVPLLSSGAATTVSVSAAPSCAGDDATASPLYVVDGQQIRICPSTCARLQTSLGADQQITDQLNASRVTQVPLMAPWVTWSAACGADGG